MPTTQELRQVARGGDTTWSKSYDHPEHGALTFKGKLPKALDLARHSAQMDNLLAEQMEPGVSPRGGTMILVAAIAGLQVLLDLPVVDERREEDGDALKVVKVYYDPEEETDIAWLTQVWMDFSEWRGSFIEAVDDLKNSSGETPGSGSSEPSTGPMASPSTTPA